jgi:hypothetical protein
MGPRGKLNPEDRESNRAVKFSGNLLRNTITDFSKKYQFCKKLKKIKLLDGLRG